MNVQALSAVLQDELNRYRELAIRAWVANKALHRLLGLRDAKVAEVEEDLHSAHRMLAEAFKQSDWYREGMEPAERDAALGGFLRALSVETNSEDVLGVLKYV